MKLIIDIEPRYCKDMRSDVKGLYYEAINRIIEAVSNGIPYDEKPQGDLISREALKKAYFNAINETSIGEVSIIDLIDKVPTVLHDNYSMGYQDGIRKALSERPQGEWEDYDNTFYKCPDCGYLLEKCCPQCQTKY